MNNERVYLKRVVSLAKSGMPIHLACDLASAEDLLGKRFFKKIKESDKQEVVKFANIVQKYIQLCSYNL